MTVDACASVVGTVMTVDACASVVGTVMTVDACASAVGTVMIVDACASAVGTVMTVEACARVVGTVMTVDVCASVVGTVMTVDACASVVGTVMTVDACASVVGTVMTVDACASVVGTVMTLDACASVVGTVMTVDACASVVAMYTNMRTAYQTSEIGTINCMNATDIFDSAIYRTAHHSLRGPYQYKCTNSAPSMCIYRSDGGSTQDRVPTNHLFVHGAQYRYRTGERVIRGRLVKDVYGAQLFDDVTYLCTQRNTAVLMYDRQRDIDAKRYGGRVVLTMRNTNSRM